ncbi:MAG: V-type ATPase 116kDa subunit family protein [Candidatus Odinarchaeota archaeon]
MLKPAKMSKFTIIALDEYADDLIRLLGNLGIAQLVNVSEKIAAYNGLIQPVEPGDYYYRVSALLSQVEGLIGDLAVQEIEDVKEKKRHQKLSEDELTKIEDEVRKIEEEYLTLSKEYDTLKEKTDLTIDEEKRLAELEENKVDLKKRVSKNLLVLREILQIEQRIEEVKGMSGKTDRSFMFEGWVEERKVKTLQESVLKITGNNCIIKIDAPKKEDKPPVLIENPKLIKPVQMLTVGFSVPSYKEIDPTLLASITFPIFFGIMFADIGHGLILLIPSLLGYISLKKGHPNFEGMVGWWVKGSPLLVSCSVSSIFFGILFGEMLGFSIVAEPWYIALAPYLLFLRQALVGLFTFFDYDGGVKILTDPNYVNPATGIAEYSPLPGELWVDPVTHLEHYSGPILFSPFHHPFLLFALSIMIGVMHLLVGLILGVVNSIKKGKILEGIVDRGFWIWFYIGLVYLAFNRGVTFTNWFSTFSLTDVSFYLFAMPFAGLIFGKLVAHRNIMEGFIGTFEVLVSSISNTISYTRILALNQVHAGFSKTFINLGTSPVYHPILHEYLPASDAGFLVFQPTLYYVMFIVTQIGLVMFLEGLLTFINTLRLHWVEWFLKFYEGGGSEFKPFKISRVYTSG